MQADIFSTSSLVYLPIGITFSSFGLALVSVPVLSNTIVSAFAYASRCFPPFIIIRLSDASFIADITDIGVVSFIAHEKSTIRTDIALVMFLVSAYTIAVPSSVYGTRPSASFSALLCIPAFRSSDSSIIWMILFSLVSSFTDSVSIVSVPSSITVPACTVFPVFFSTAYGSPVIDASLTIASPWMTFPSIGITLPFRIFIWSPFLTSFSG